MNIVPEAQDFLRELLADNSEAFIRVGRVTVGGGCCAKINLGVTIDENFNEDDDIRQDVNGIPVVTEKAFSNLFTDVRIEIEPDQGLVVRHS